MRVVSFKHKTPESFAHLPQLTGYTHSTIWHYAICAF